MPIVPAAQLADRLRAGAAGAPCIEAAVELLVLHGAWLTHPVFRDRCVIDGHDVGARDVAGVDWSAAADIVRRDQPSGRLLLLAAELAGADTGAPLGSLLRGHEPYETFLILGAIAHVLGETR
jgi:hypothetical protein